MQPNFRLRIQLYSHLREQRARNARIRKVDMDCHSVLEVHPMQLWSSLSLGCSVEGLLALSQERSEFHSETKLGSEGEG